MRYEGTIYRPPSEWQSYILQVTIGCSHNACTFCGMFKGQRYRERPLHEVLEDISMAKATYGHVDQVFLCDGDALSRSTEDLLAILRKLREVFPGVREISTYASAKGILKKCASELRILKEAGLSKAYLGVESGDDKVLHDTHIGVTAAQTLQAGKMIVGAGMELYAIILIGLAGRARSKDNAVATARIINDMKPRYLAAMTYTPVPGTPLFKDIEEGGFDELTTLECLQETKWLVELLDVEGLQVVSNHVSNNIDVSGVVPGDKPRMLEMLNAAIARESFGDSWRML